MIGECRGRFKITDFSSEHVTAEGKARDGSEAKFVGDVENQGEWEFKKGGVQGQGADQMAEQVPGLKQIDADCSDAELQLRTIVGSECIEPLRERLGHLHAQLAGLANSKEMANAKGAACPLADPRKIPELEFDRKMRAEAETKQMVRGIKATLRSPKFPPCVASISDRTCSRAELRCCSLSDDDVTTILDALPPKAWAPGENEVGLEVLDLSYNELTDKGVQGLMFALAQGRAPCLKTLNLRDTQITELGRRQLGGLKLLRKDLKVLLDDGKLGE